MSFSTKALKEFITEMVEQAISEAAKQPDDAEASGFALSVAKNGKYVYLILYESAGLEQLCDEMAKQPGHLSIDGKLDSVLYMSPNPVVGYIRLENDDCGWVLRNSAANKGYGPMMHDVALSYVGKKGVLPDRESHTEASRKVWRYYALKRNAEVRFYPLSEDDPCAVYQDDPDARFLDARYSMRNPNLGMVQSLIAKGDQVTQAIKQKTQLPMDELFRRLGSFFFDQMYQ